MNMQKCQCGHCGSEFMARVWRINKATREGKPSFCSIRCAVLSRPKGRKPEAACLARWVAHHADPSVRFWRKVDRSGGPDACWPWQGRRTRQGYGNLKFKNKALAAHRMSLFLETGEMPRNLLACHRCDNPSCVNPAHLFWGTDQENMDDCSHKGRRPKGEGHWAARLTASDVLAIRADDRSLKLVAEQYGISIAYVSQIRKRLKWRHLDDEINSTAASAPNGRACGPLTVEAGHAHGLSQ